MEPARFALGVRIAASRKRVYAELADPRRQSGLQPLLVSVEERPVEGDEMRAFEAVERIVLFGPLAIRNRIRVELRTVAPPARIDFHARSPVGPVRVASRFTLEPEGESACAVREEVEVRVPVWLRPLRPWIVREAITAQAGLLRTLRMRLEREDPGSGDGAASP